MLNGHKIIENLEITSFINSRKIIVCEGWVSSFNGQGNGHSFTLWVMADWYWMLNLKKLRVRSKPVALFDGWSPV